MAALSLTRFQTYYDGSTFNLRERRRPRNAAGARELPDERD